MPMSPRLLRPRATGTVVVATDADARAYVLAVNAADGQPLEPAVQLAIDAFVVGCKADGIWSAIKASCILMGARTLSGALTPLVGTAPTNNGPFVAGDYNRKTGLIGNGTSKFLDTQRNNNADPQNSVHHAIYASIANTGTRFYMGATATSVGAMNMYTFNTTTVEFRNRNSGSQGGFTSAAGFVGHSRASSASFSLRANGVTNTPAVASQTPASQNVAVYAAGGVASAYADGRLSFYSVGESLTLSLLDSRVTTLYNAIGAAIP